MKTYSYDALALAKSLRADAETARERRKFAETDFAEGFWEGFELALKAAADICEARVLIDRTLAGEKFPEPSGKVVPLKRKASPQ
jgi:hypothetical protein